MFKIVWYTVLLQIRLMADAGMTRLNTNLATKDMVYPIVAGLVTLVVGAIVISAIWNASP